MSSSLRLLSAGSIRRGVTNIIEIFERKHGVSVDVDFSSAPKVRARVLAGELTDAVIASAEALDILAAAGKINVSSRTVIGSTGMGVAMSKVATVPDLSSKHAFRKAMLEADLVAYNEGSSGLYAAQLVDALNLREPLGEKIHIVKNGAEMFGVIRSVPGKVYGLANITNILDEIEKGGPIVLAAHLPDEIQNVTTYETAVANDSPQSILAGEFVKLFATDEGRMRLSDAGVEAG